MPQIDEQEVRNRLKYDDDLDVTNELYNFGLFLLKESAEDHRRVDTKASAMAGYAGVIVALLISSIDSWKDLLSPFSKLLVFWAALSALAAAVIGVYAMKLRDFDWFSTDEWFPADCLDKGKLERLKRYRILTVWGHWNSHKKNYTDKTRLVRWEQGALAVAGALLFLVLILMLWANFFASSIPSAFFLVPSFLEWFRFAWW